MSDADAAPAVVAAAAPAATTAAAVDHGTPTASPDPVGPTPAAIDASALPAVTEQQQQQQQQQQLLLQQQQQLLPVEVARSVAPAKLSSLERRLRGISGPDSQDSFTSSVVGFGVDAPPAPATTATAAAGPIGFQHFTRAGQVLPAAPASTATRPVASGSLSPTPNAPPREEHFIGSQDKTKLIDYDAPTPPPMTLAGLMTSLQDGTNGALPFPKPAPAPVAPSAAAVAPAFHFPPAPATIAHGASFVLPDNIHSPAKTVTITAKSSVTKKRKTVGSTGSPSPKPPRKTPGPKKEKATKATTAVSDGTAAATPEKDAKKPKLPPTSLSADFTSSTRPQGAVVTTMRAATPPIPTSAAPASPSLPLSPPSTSKEGGPAAGGSGSGNRVRKDITSYFGGNPGNSLMRQPSILGSLGVSSAMQVDSTGVSNDNAPTQQGAHSQDLETETDDNSDVMIIDSEPVAAVPATIVSPLGAVAALPATPSTPSPVFPITAASQTPTPPAPASGSSTPTPGSAASSTKKPKKPRAPSAKPRKSKAEAAAAAAASTLSPSTTASAALASITDTGLPPETAARLREVKQLLHAKELAMAEREAALEARERDHNQMQTHVTELEAKIASMQSEHDAYKASVATLLQTLFKDLCQHQQRATEEKLLRDAVSIGRLVPRIEQGMHLGQQQMVSEVWEDGEAFIDTRRHIASLLEEKERLAAEKTKNVAKKRQLTRLTGKQQQQGEQAAAAASASALSLDDESADANGGFKRPAPVIVSSDTAYSLFESDEFLTIRLNQVKASLAEYDAKLRSLELQKKSLVRLTKLHNDCRASRFNFHPTLNDRYIVLEMIGKGGFSEVFRAYDLQDLRYVACKIHQLNPQWSEARKINYTRHATREYNIHKSLHHSKIVQLYDVFAIDTNAFCTVLEWCEGSDLDMYLKMKHTLSEREARTIITQVFQGLKYLNEQKQKIIHYDLKPGNILFHKGEVKLTDFGLSKITPEGATDGIELTSQGSGTYWYLPPECFSATPIISSKVDVWSAGVVLYQMLYGRKPFGHGQTADALITNKTIQDARHLEFPKLESATTAASSSKKDAAAASAHSSQLTPTQEFIKACLRYNPADRPEILTIFQDKYFMANIK